MNIIRKRIIGATTAHLRRAEVQLNEASAAYIQPETTPRTYAPVQDDVLPLAAKAVKMLRVALAARRAGVLYA